MKTVFIIFLLIIFQKIYSQDIIYATDGHGVLYSLDLLKCTKKEIGNTGHIYSDIAITPNGKLWGLDSGTLFNINTIDASSKFIRKVNSGYGVSLVSLNDSILLTDTDSLHAIKINDTIEYNMGYIGFSASGDLAWHDGNLYISADNLARINLNQSKSNIFNVEIFKTINTGATFGLISANVNKGGVKELSLIGFDCGGGISKLCSQSNMICPNLITECFYGAASIPFKFESSSVDICSISSSLSELENEIEIYPNFIPQKATIKLNQPISNYNFKLYNQIGKIVREFNLIHSNELDFYRNELPIGIYFLQINSENDKFFRTIKLEVID